MTKFSAQLPVFVFKEGKLFVAYTPVLDLSTSGKTYEQVIDRFNEVVEIFLEELAKNGTLDDVLLNFGWHKVKKHWSPPSLIAQELQPLELALK